MTPTNGTEQNGVSEWTKIVTVAKQAGKAPCTVRSWAKKLGLESKTLTRAKGELGGKAPIAIRTKEVAALLELMASGVVPQVRRQTVASNSVKTGVRRGATQAQSMRAAEIERDLHQPEVNDLSELKACLRRAAQLCKKLGAEATVDGDGAELSRNVTERVEL